MHGVLAQYGTPSTAPWQVREIIPQDPVLALSVGVVIGVAAVLILLKIAKAIGL